MRQGRVVRRCALASGLLFVTIVLSFVPGSRASATPGLRAGSCFSYAYECVAGGYQATAATTGDWWAWRYYGEQGAGGIGTPPHNCTLYAAWGLQRTGWTIREGPGLTLGSGAPHSD